MSRFCWPHCARACCVFKDLTWLYCVGVLYCTRITAKLVQMRLKIPPNRLRVIALNSPFLLEGVRVTFLEANHCPGAAMVLFEPPCAPPVLHTGDCRCVHCLAVVECVPFRIAPFRCTALVLSGLCCLPSQDVSNVTL